MGAVDPGSFRDPLSRVYIRTGEVQRGLSAEALAEFEAVAASEFFPSLVAEGKVVATESVPVAESFVGDQWAGALRHERIAVISYPFEWTFEMLRNAALLQLEVTRRALAEGFTTKDATAYNVQFDGVRPVFIDVGSFERPPKGEPWPGYRQFCELFLNPLLVQALAGIPFQPWLRGSLDGISPGHVASLLRGRHRLDPKLLVHVKFHARAERRYANHDLEQDVRQDLRQAGFGPKVILAQLDNLERTVRGLRNGEQSSTWSGYGNRAHYDDEDMLCKEAAVTGAVAATGARSVLDLGANDGRFSLVAVEAGAERAVAVDADHFTVDRLYRHLRNTGEQRVLPLVLDLTDPTGGSGWRSQERASFVSRVRPDLVLCLAVVHHLALTNNVPFDHIVDLLADFAAPVLVEFPRTDDPMVARLLARKRPGLFAHYDLPQWEEALARRFTIQERIELPSGRRVMHRAAPTP